MKTTSQTTQPAQSPDATPGYLTPTGMIGVLSRVGTFLIHNHEVTGYLVECTRETLERVSHLPMYRTVDIVKTEELDSLRADRAAYYAAAEQLTRPEIMLSVEETVRCLRAINSKHALHLTNVLAYLKDLAAAHASAKGKL